MLLQGLGCSIGVEDIVTKAINVLGLVRTECGQSLPVRSVTLLQQFPKSLGYGHQRVKGEQVCNEVIVFDKLPLLIAYIFGNHAIAPKAHPLHEFVKRFAFVGRCLDRVP
jgi:hypothetical protein